MQQPVENAQLFMSITDSGLTYTKGSNQRSNVGQIFDDAEMGRKTGTGIKSV